MKIQAHSRWQWTGRVALTGLATLTTPAAIHGQDQIQVDSTLEIRDGVSGFTGPILAGDAFGSAVTRLGDLDGDGVEDLLVGARGTDDGASNAGALYVLFMNSGGAVKSQQKISRTAGSLTLVIPGGSRFGSALTTLGDLQGDGTLEVVVGGPATLSSSGFARILSLLPDGTVQSDSPVSISGSDGDFIGSALATVGDLDGDGVTELAVGAPGTNVGSSGDRGAVWIAFLRADRTLKGLQKIGSATGGFLGTLATGDTFGTSLAALGDLDGDGVEDLAVGAPGDDAGGTNRGAVWILFLKTDGTVKSFAKISDVDGNFFGLLDDSDGFGFALACPGDVDDDGVVDLAVAASGDDDGGVNYGAVWILLLSPNGTVKGTVLAPGHSKLSELSGGLAGLAHTGDGLGLSLGAIGDWNGDAVADLALGLSLSEVQGINPPLDTGSLFLLDLGDGCPATATFRNMGANPASLTVTPPVLGGTMLATVNLTGTGFDAATILVYSDPASIHLGSNRYRLGGGTLLFLSGAIGGTSVGGQTVAQHGFPIPADPALCGLTATVQAAHRPSLRMHPRAAMPLFSLSNAYDVRIGH